MEVSDVRLAGVRASGSGWQKVASLRVRCEERGGGVGRGQE